MMTKRYFLFISILVLLSSLAGCGGFSAIRTQEKNGFYELSVPESKLILKIPGDGMVKRNVNLGGGTANPRYFNFEDNKKGIIISGWFEPLDRFPGMDKYWDGKVSSWRKMGMWPPTDVNFKTINGWKSIFYNDQISDSRTMYSLSSSWLQAGTWIDLHLSITAISGSIDARYQLEQVLNSIQITEK